MKEISGKRFGMLVAIAPTSERRHKAVVWEFKCDCGKKTRTTQQSVASGSTKSCGCLQALRTRRNNYKNMGIARPFVDSDDISIYDEEGCE